jgi:hypothetical protein
MELLLDLLRHWNLASRILAMGVVGAMSIVRAMSIMGIPLGISSAMHPMLLQKTCI